MRGQTSINARSLLILTAILAGIASVLVACSSPKEAQAPAQAPGPRRFLLQGRVVSIDKGQNKVTVEHGDIPGFMGAMTMAYPVKNPQLLDSIKPEDHITADVMVDDTDVWLENIAVAPNKDQTKPPASNDSQTASPGSSKQ